MTIYKVRATRWRLGWELHVAGLGVTQCRTLGGAERVARNFIETCQDVSSTQGTRS